MRGAHNSVAKRNFNLFNVLTSPDPDSQDLVAVCDYVLEKLPNPPQELYLIGYSYGATVAASALQQMPQVSLPGTRVVWGEACAVSAAHAMHAPKTLDDASTRLPLPHTSPPHLLSRSLAMSR